MAERLEPPADLVMFVDRNNTAHVLAPDDPRFGVHTLCGGQRHDIGALRDVWDTLAAPWSLLTDPTYRAWPPWPCQTCTGTTLRAAPVPPVEGDAERMNG